MKKAEVSLQDQWTSLKVKEFTGFSGSFLIAAGSLKEECWSTSVVPFSMFLKDVKLLR